MSAPPFATETREGYTYLAVDGRTVAQISPRPVGDQRLVVLFEPQPPVDDIQVWCESLEAATALAEFHARMCARLVAAGARS